ncbi:MAG: hypothetical protein ACFFAO_04465 [Candidatus Hermodarchaeota archaeon]
MANDQISILIEIKNSINKLIYLNSIIATELIKITENSAALRHGENFLKNSPCIPEHNNLNKNIIELVKNYTKPDEYSNLEKHVLKHLE